MFIPPTDLPRERSDGRDRPRVSLKSFILTTEGEAVRTILSVSSHRSYRKGPGDGLPLFREVTLPDEWDPAPLAW